MTPESPWVMPETGDPRHPSTFNLKINHRRCPTPQI
jgi:hypothetical protein